MDVMGSKSTPNELDYSVGITEAKKRQEILGIIISQQWNEFTQVKKPQKISLNS
jgi:hypothetical protein